MRVKLACVATACAMLVAPASVSPSAAQAQADRAGADFSLTGAAVQGGLITGLAPAGTVSLSLDGAAVPFDSDGRFIIGFDRDHAAASTLVATLADRRSITRQLRITPRAWRTQHINVARRPGGATEEYLRRREGELARIAAARSRNARSDGWRQLFVWPAQGRISGVFGSQRIYRGEPAAFHSGVDIAPGAGALVVAPADGVVVLAGPPMFSLEGNLVILDHGHGLNSAFLHLATVRVREGDTIRQGQPIGTVGATGRATGPHLHWSLKWKDARLDPQPLVGARTGGEAR